MRAWKKIKSHLKDNSGDVYIQTVVAILILFSVLSLALQIFDSVQKKIWLDGMTSSITRNIQINGKVTEEVNVLVQEIENKLGTPVTIEYEGTFIGYDKRIQLGDMIKVKITTSVNCLKIGKHTAIKIPLKCEGIATSEKYWKD